MYTYKNIHLQTQRDEHFHFLFAFLPCNICSIQLLFSEGDTVERDEIGDFVEQFVTLKSQETINEEIAEAFAKFETSEDFVISKADFREILTKLGDEPLSKAQAEMIIGCLDSKSENVNISGLNQLPFLFKSNDTNINFTVLSELIVRKLYIRMEDGFIIYGPYQHLAV